MSAEIRPLTSLRFLLALWVLGFHLRGSCEGLPLVDRAVLLGHVAVPGFFVLSGVVLTWTYFQEAGTRLLVGAYFRARAARIVPLYAVGFLLGVPLFWAKALGGAEPVSVPDLVLATLAVMLFLQAWVPSYALAVNSPAWSLSVEMAFYATFPWLGAWISRLGTRSILVVAGAALLVSCVVVVCAQAALYGSPAWVSAIGHPERGWVIDLLRFSPAFHVVDFLVGICIGVLTVRRRFLTDLGSVMFVGGGVVGLILLVAFGGHIGFLWANGPLAVGCFGLLIRGLAGLSERHWLHRMLSAPALLVLGRASYALYILHLPVIDWTWQVAKVVLGSGSTPGWWFLAVTVPLIIGLSLAAYWLIEEPLRRRFGRTGRVVPDGR